MPKYISLKVLVSLSLGTLSLAGCGKSSSSDSAYDTTTAEVTGEAIAGQVNASDNGGGVVSLNLPKQNAPLSSQLKQLALQVFESPAYASSCSTSATLTSGSGCVAGVTNISLGGCTGYLGTWSGTFTASFTNPTTVCGSTIAATSSGNAITFSSSAGITLTTASGASIESDSNSSGYASALAGGTTVTCGTGGCSSNRSVNIAGVHRKAMSASGITLFDHTLSTPAPLVVTGTGSSKQITSGTLQLQHNLAHYTATSQITQALTFSSGCCLPVSGSMTTTFTSGSKSGTETTVFGPSCGSATVNGNAVSLSYCL